MNLMMARYENVTLGTVSYSETSSWGESTQPFSESYVYAKLLERARQAYPGYSNYTINIIQNNQNKEERSTTSSRSSGRSGFQAGFEEGYSLPQRRYILSASAQVYAEKWVEDPKPVEPKRETPKEPTEIRPSKKKHNLESALQNGLIQALENIPGGSRIAIDRITCTGEDKSLVKEIILDVLLEEEYKVVAKEYLEKIKEELYEQSSGDYNERTKAKENNLSASGYFLDCKISNNKIRIILINVSTGEYASTSSVNYE